MSPDEPTCEPQDTDRLTRAAALLLQWLFSCAAETQSQDAERDLLQMLHGKRILPNVGRPQAMLE